MNNVLKSLAVLSVLAVVIFFSALPASAMEIIEGGTLPNEGQSVTAGQGINVVVPGGPGFIMISPTGFVGISNTTEYQFGLGGGLYNPGLTFSTYEGALTLPHGATITKLVVYYLDNVAPNISVLLGKYNLETATASVIAGADTTGADPANRYIEITTFNGPVIDNLSNVYWIEVGMPGNFGELLKLMGVRIDYSYPVSLPVVVK